MTTIILPKGEFSKKKYSLKRGLDSLMNKNYGNPNYFSTNKNGRIDYYCNNIVIGVYPKSINEFYLVEKNINGSYTLVKEKQKVIKY